MQHMDAKRFRLAKHIRNEPMPVHEDVCTQQEHFVFALVASRVLSQKLGGEAEGNK
jgi:hypothetical protein